MRDLNLRVKHPKPRKQRALSSPGPRTLLDRMHNVSETLLSAVGYTNANANANANAESKTCSPFDSSGNRSLKFANSSSSLESLSNTLEPGNTASQKPGNGNHGKPGNHGPGSPQQKKNGYNHACNGSASASPLHNKSGHHHRANGHNGANNGHNGANNGHNGANNNARKNQHVNAGHKSSGSSSSDKSAPVNGSKTCDDDSHMLADSVVVLHTNHSSNGGVNGRTDKDSSAKGRGGKNPGRHSPKGQGHKARVSK